VGGTPPRSPIKTPPLPTKEIQTQNPGVQVNATTINNADTNISQTYKLKLETTDKAIWMKLNYQNLKNQHSQELANKTPTTFKTLIYALAKPANIIPTEQERDPRHLSPSSKDMQQLPH